jgi:hypothetical protein
MSNFDELVDTKSKNLSLSVAFVLLPMRSRFMSILLELSAAKMAQNCKG